MRAKRLVLPAESKSSDGLCSSEQPDPRRPHRKVRGIRDGGRDLRAGQKLPLTQGG